VVEFLSPVEAGDLRRQSIPMSYVMVTASSIDGQGHDVQVYLDISGEWTSGDVSQPITWAPAQVTYSSGTLQAWTVQLQNQQPLTEQNQLAAWGTMVWATPQQSGLTYQSGQDVVVRGQFVDNGKLSDTNDTNYRPISDNWPVFAFCADLGQVGGSPVTVPVSIGQVRTPAVSYLGQDLQPPVDQLLHQLGGHAGLRPGRPDRCRSAGRPAGRDPHQGRRRRGECTTPGSAPSRCARPTGGRSLW
jgi:hypothetical protein